MQRKFECLKCHNQFEADDQTMVRCPDCGSDNVEIAHFHLPKGWWKWGLALCVIVSVCIFLINVSRTDETPSPLVGDGPIDTTEIVSEDTLYDSDDDEEDGPTFEKVTSIEVGKLSYTDGEGYSFSIKVKDAPVDKYYVALREHGGEKLIARSEDGEHFKNIPPSEKDGMFDVAVFFIPNDSVLCELPVTGFESQAVVSQKMTKEKLQLLIEDCDASITGADNWISANYKLHFTGLSSEDEMPSKLSDVQTQLSCMWSKATIIDIKYDDKNRITDIYIDVQKKN